MPGMGQRDVGGLVDAKDFLRFTTRLREVHERVDAARVSPEQKRRWQRRLMSLAVAGQRDLADAKEQLHRFAAEVDRRR